MRSCSGFSLRIVAKLSNKQKKQKNQLSIDQATSTKVLIPFLRQNPVATSAVFVDHGTAPKPWRRRLDDLVGKKWSKAGFWPWWHHGFHMKIGWKKCSNMFIGTSGSYWSTALWIIKVLKIQKLVYKKKSKAADWSCTKSGCFTNEHRQFTLRLHRIKENTPWN